MKAKISKSQLEVWDWKERAFKNIEDIPEDERVKYIFSKTNKTISRLKKLKEVTMK